MRTGQAKNPSLARDLLMLGDVYLTLGWMAFQRLRHGPLWRWETRGQELTASVTQLRPQEEEERPKTGTPKRG